MAKSLLRLKARQMRKNEGKSIKNIASILDVAKSTISMWCNDIELNKFQIEALLNKRDEGLRRGQIVAAMNKRERWLKKVEEYRNLGIKKLKKLSKKEYFIAGLALYLAEGAKTTRKIVFTNSDPKLIKFMHNWLQNFLEVPLENFKFYVIINTIHTKAHVMRRK